MAVVTAGIGLCSPQTSLAQTGNEALAGRLEEVIVTARKREERALDVPVVSTELTNEQLEQFITKDFMSLSARVPGLIIGDSTGPFGGTIAIRGIGTAALSATTDQSVSINIDGLQVSHGLFLRSGLFDMEQIEVLRGPQALFFGKNSPGGIVTIRTADPTDALEIRGSLGYETEAKESLGEFVVSSPLGATLGGRLAVLVSDLDGFLDNTARPDLYAVGPGGKRPAYDRMPNQQQVLTRGTLTWRPLENFDARLKLNYANAQTDGDGTPQQWTYCPEGPSDPAEPCRADEQIAIADMDTDYFLVSNNGTPYNDQEQYFGTIELNYEPTDSIHLTSVTSYSRIEQQFMINGTFQPSRPLIAADQDFDQKDFTTELRLTTDFEDSRLNGMLGAFYQDGDIYYRPTLAANTSLGFLPAIVRDGAFLIDIEAVSAFGQLIWDLTDTVELAGGARWTSETRKLKMFSQVPGPDFGPWNPLVPDVPRIDADDVSPEVTLTWRPADTLTLFGAYKEGFKSGSFNSDQLSPTGRDFGPEYARGGELGLKTLLSDETLRMNLALYYYRYRDLQVGTIEGAGATAMTRVLNAAEATAKGAEFDFEYAPAGLSGLTFNGSLAYNEGEFEEFPSAPCYGGQTQALGCNIDLTGDGIGDAQNLAGTPLNAAPDWTGSIGFDLDRPIGAGSLGIGLSSAATYEGSIYRDLTQAPGTRQSDFWKLNANLRLYDDSRGWEAALIGKNLTDEYTGSKCAVGAFGGPLGGLAPNPRGGVTHSDTDEVICILGRGREIWLRLTWNFGGPL